MRFLVVTHRLTDLMRKPGTTAGCIYHTHGKFMLDNSTLYHNHAGDSDDGPGDDNDDRMMTMTLVMQVMTAMTLAMPTTTV